MQFLLSEKLKQTNESWMKMIDNLPEGVITVCNECFTLHFVNKKFKKLFLNKKIVKFERVKDSIEDDDEDDKEINDYIREHRLQ